jgi:hypothetical protein
MSSNDCRRILREFGDLKMTCLLAMVYLEFPLEGALTSFVSRFFRALHHVSYA